MTQCLGKYVSNLAEALQPMLELFKKDTICVWNETQEKAFLRVKQRLTQAPILTCYDPEKPITISVETSSYWLGPPFFKNKILSVIAYASHTLTQTEGNYAQIEKNV